MSSEHGNGGAAGPRVYGRHEQHEGILSVSPEIAFPFLDDPSHLSAHMSERSWMMGGGQMAISTDDGGGRRVGSRIHLGGSVLGVSLGVDGIVTEYDPPRRKRWETLGEPRLLVIGHYRMGLELHANGAGSTLRITLDYSLPDRGISHLLGLLFGPYYARWCTRSMVRDAVRHFRAKG